MQSLILVSRRFEKCRISCSFPDASKHVVIHIRIKTLRKARKSIFHTRFTTLRKCSLSYSFLNASNKRSPSNSFHDTSNNGNIRKQMVWGVFAVIIVFKCLQSRKTRTHHTLGPDINIMEVRVFAEWTNMKNGYRHLSISIDSLF